jgi:hypothetical protein
MWLCWSKPCIGCPAPAVPETRYTILGCFSGRLKNFFVAKRLTYSHFSGFTSQATLT